MLYSWFTAEPKWKDCINPDVATLLLTGLITDTRSFQNPNTTPKSLEVAANLLDLGARQQEIIQHIYKTKPLSTLRIWGRALNRIQIDPESRIVWSWIGREDLGEMGAKSQETHGLLDELISTVPDADLHIMFTEVEEGGMKASLRSSVAIDANVAAGKLFGGGGHSRASGFRVKNYGNFQLQVIECIKQLKDELTRQRNIADAALLPPVTPVQKPVPQMKPAKKEEAKKPEKTKGVDIVQTLGSANGNQ